MRGIFRGVTLQGGGGLTVGNSPWKENSPGGIFLQNGGESSGGQLFLAKRGGFLRGGTCTGKGTGGESPAYLLS